MARNCIAPLTRRATRAGSCSPPRASSLRFALFPLGEMADKRAVRAEAERLGLPVAAKPDSQDICFVPSGPLRRHGGAAAPGSRRAGRHRRSQTVACWDGTTASPATRWGRASGLVWRRWLTAYGRRWSRWIPRQRRVVVGPRDAGVRTVRLRDVNWLVQPPSGALACQVKLRAREAPAAGEDFR